MKKKSKGQIYLEQVEMLDAIIKNKLIEKEQWMDMALGLTASSETVVIERNGKKERHNMEKVQSSGSKSKMADAVAKCVDIEAEIDELIDKLIDTKKDVTRTLEQLYSPTEYKLLHMRYIQYIPLIKISEMWGVDYTNITTTHGRAVKRVGDILNKK